MSDFVVWNNKRTGFDCSVTVFEGMEKTFPLLAGESLVDSFPSDARFLMNPETPDNTRLTDCVTNTNAVIVGSQKLVDVFKAQSIGTVEYLPVTILDHKNKAVSSSYWIIHPVEPVDCLDLANCNPRYSRILPDQISKIESLVLLDEKIPPERMVFRCLNFYRKIIVRRSFATILEKSGLTGFGWSELSEYT